MRGSITEPLALFTTTTTRHVYISECVSRPILPCEKQKVLYQDKIAEESEVPISSTKRSWVRRIRPGPPHPQLADYMLGGPRHSVMLPAEAYEMRKRLFILSLAKS
jgi:hypothetical protein